jgi:hypothetical protein
MQVGIKDKLQSMLPHKMFQAQGLNFSYMFNFKILFIKVQKIENSYYFLFSFPLPFALTLFRLLCPFFSYFSIII